VPVKEVFDTVLKAALAEGSGRLTMPVSSASGFEFTLVVEMSSMGAGLSIADEHTQAVVKRTAWNSFIRGWHLYLFEGVELALFMISACVCTVVLFHPDYSALQMLPNAAFRRVFMGVAMGLTAVLIIHSPMGKSSGAHFNPAITLTYLRLRKIAVWDAVFYVLFQFVGGAFGVGVSSFVLGDRLADPAVDYAVTVPGRYGTAAAFAAELFMAALLMGVVLLTSNRPRFAPYTSYCVGILIAFYILLFAPVSGFSINPARTFGSAVFAHLWSAGWVYFTAPLLGMMSAAEAYLRSYGPDRILCAKLHPDPAYPCPFRCHFPLHRHPAASRN
jgi:aquaporin Z